METKLKKLIYDERLPVPINLCVNPCARRLILRISSIDNQVHVTVPTFVSEQQAIEFAVSRTDWIRKHIKTMPKQIHIGLGTFVPIEGHHYRVSSAKGGQTRRDSKRVLVLGPPSEIGMRLEDYLIDLAREKLYQASQDYADTLGVDFTKISVRDNVSRWGSCSIHRSLSYAWRLIMAPSKVLRYVAAHEVAHLAEMNHSDSFWKTLESIHGPYEFPKIWLRTYGTNLHRYIFRA